MLLTVIDEPKTIDQDTTGSNGKNVNHVTKVVPDIKVVPVVSSSILLRHFDDDSDCESEREVIKETCAVPVTNISKAAENANELPSSDIRNAVKEDGSTASVNNKNIVEAVVSSESDNNDDVRSDAAVNKDDVKAEKTTVNDNANDVRADELSPASREDVVKTNDPTSSDNKVVGADRFSSSDNKNVSNTDKVCTTVNTCAVKEDEPCSSDKEVVDKAGDSCTTKSKEVLKTDESLSSGNNDAARKDADRIEDKLIDAEVASGRIVRVKPVESPSKIVFVDSICGSRGNDTTKSSDKDCGNKIGHVSTDTSISPVDSAALVDVEKEAKQHIATCNISPVTTPTEIEKVSDKLSFGTDLPSAQQEKLVKVLKIELKKVSPEQSGVKNVNVDIISTQQQSLKDHMGRQTGTSTATPGVQRKLDAAAMLEHTKGLRALSAQSLSALIDSHLKPDKPKGSSKNVFAPQPGNSESYGAGAGFYQSHDGIQKWLKHSASEPATSVSCNNDIGTSDDNGLPRRVVSDFIIPKKPARKPPKPLTLKKEIPHLNAIPGIAKSDLMAGKKCNTWTQKDYQGPMAAAMWTSKPTSYEVKFPPLPKRLLAREGSIGKLRDTWVIPQIKQIETLKRECGRYPGLRVPCSKRGSMYSVSIAVPSCSRNCTDTHDNDKDQDNEDSATAGRAEEKGASGN